ncbi:MAG: hypothetical protein HQM16_18555 [Deltaproteobacteria bacterium]|nr:hypothetical protein [Deltaproteobacteria bacterium]
MMALYAMEINSRINKLGRFLDVFIRNKSVMKHGDFVLIQKKLEDLQSKGKDVTKLWEKLDRITIAKK